MKGIGGGVLGGRNVDKSLKEYILLTSFIE